MIFFFYTHHKKNCIFHFFLCVLLLCGNRTKQECGGKSPFSAFGGTVVSEPEQKTGTKSWQK